MPSSSLLLAYIKDRKQFGVPIGSFQAIKHKMSNMFLAIERARALCYFAVAAINEDTPNRADGCLHGQGRRRRLPELRRSRVHSDLRRHRLHLGARLPSLRQEGRHRWRALRWRRRALPRRGRRPRSRFRLTGVRAGESLIAALGLAPHPEGGWFRRTWVADADDGTRPAGSAIYYLLLEGEVSAPHRVDATELWHFYDGDPLELRREWPDGRHDVQVLGSRRSLGSVAPAGGGRRRLAVGAPARALRAGRGDSDARLRLRGLRAPSGSRLRDELPVPVRR